MTADCGGLPPSPAETLYFFGGNNVSEWQSLFDQYEAPPYTLPHTSTAYSFGIAGERRIGFPSGHSRYCRFVVELFSLSFQSSLVHRSVSLINYLKTSVQTSSKLKMLAPPPSVGVSGSCS